MLIARAVLESIIIYIGGYRHTHLVLTLYFIRLGQLNTINKNHYET